MHGEQDVRYFTSLVKTLFPPSREILGSKSGTNFK